MKTKSEITRQDLVSVKRHLQAARKEADALLSKDHGNTDTWDLIWDLLDSIDHCRIEKIAKAEGIIRERVLINRSAEGFQNQQDAINWEIESEKRKIESEKRAWADHERAQEERTHG